MQLFANNAASVLASGISSAATTLQLAPGTGARFPNPANGNYFVLTLYQMSGSTEVNHEIVKCSARNGDTLTVARAQEGTIARAFNNADPLSLRLTAGSLTPAAIGAYDASNPAGFIRSVPNASANTAGVIKVGANLAIDGAGVLSALPPAASGAMVLLVNVNIAAPVANIDFLNLFTASYDSYLIEGTDLKSSGNDLVQMRFANNGVVDTAVNFSSTDMDGRSFSATGAIAAGGKGGSFIVNLRNCNDAIGLKAIFQESVGQSTLTPQYESRNGKYAYWGGALSGFRLFFCLWQQLYQRRDPRLWHQNQLEENMTELVLDNGVLREARQDEIDEITARRNAAVKGKTPQAVTMLQARLALIAAGHFKAVDAFIASMPGDEGDAARAYWDFAKQVVRDDPLVSKLATHLNLSSIELDQLFIAASNL